MVTVLRNFSLIFLLFFLLPSLVAVGGHLLEQGRPRHWWEGRTDTSRQAPDPATTPEAVVQVYAARAFGWRGAMGVHTWIAVKPANAAGYTRLEVLGWGVRRGRQAVRLFDGTPDGYWFGSRPELLAELRGDGVDAIIDRIHAAARRYPYMRQYRLWPGPNSNTFTAFIGREIPELRLDLPPTAIGKDYLAGVAAAPSGTGGQVSLYGLAGLLVAREEGVEVNLLGLTFGLDLLRPALKLPGLGRIGLR